MSIESANKELVSRFLAAFGEGRWDDPENPVKPEQVLDFLSDDVDWWVPGDAYPDGRMTKERYRNTLAMLATMADGPLLITPLEWTLAGDRVAVEAKSHMKLKNGHVYENGYHFLCKVRDGKIVAFKEYCDLAPTVRAFGGQAFVKD